MARKEELISFGRIGWHKGFYQDEDIMKSLCKIRYTDFLNILMMTSSHMTLPMLFCVARVIILLFVCKKCWAIIRI